MGVQSSSVVIHAWHPYNADARGHADVVCDGRWRWQEAHCAGALPVWGKPGTNEERTFLAVKPDGVQRGLVGDIISRFEKRGYKLVGLKMVWPTQKMAEEHYADLSKARGEAPRMP